VNASAIPRLAALVVNYQSGAFAETCVRSLRREWELLGAAPDDLNVVVVDNASPTDQEPWLDALERSGARVVRAAENLGYARGMNRALEEAAGEAGDVVAVLNPDLAFLPGSLGVLLAALDASDVGAVAPRACVEPLETIQLPPNTMPTPAELRRTLRVHTDAEYGRAYARRRFERCREWWTRTAAFDTQLLSGACLLLRRGVIERIGGLFDPRYPLYFEDTDLCRRVLDSGLRLVQEPRARVVHHWARSSGVGASFAGAPQARYEVSLAAYMRRWHGRFGAWRARRLARRLGGAEVRPIHEFVDLGSVEQPPRLELGRRGAFVLELGLAPNLLLAAGVLGRGASYRFPSAAWEWLFQSRYFLRALDRWSGELIGAWGFEKSSPARSRPLTEAEQGAARTREAIP
jgi:GT2 family glycosyltransferase